MKRRLLVSDLHLTDREKDNYRWDLFPWLEKQIKEHKVDRLYMMGDLTDFKDKHSSILTNKIVEVFSRLAKLCPVVLLKGNHDFIQSEKPFFRFLEQIPDVTYVNSPWEYHDTGDLSELFLPHTKTPIEDWKDINFSQYDIVYLHQCVIGSKGANDFEMEHGLDPSFFAKKKCRVISGDIHVPQIVGSHLKGQVEYIGSPYPVAFGDHFKARCLLIDDNGDKDLFFPTIQKRAIKIKNPDALKLQRLKSGDQVSVKLQLTQAEFVSWPDYKRQCLAWCDEKGIVVHSIALEPIVKEIDKKKEAEAKKQRSYLSDPKEIINMFGKKEKLDPLLIKEGQALLA